MERIEVETNSYIQYSITEVVPQLEQEEIEENICKEHSTGHHIRDKSNRIE